MDDAQTHEITALSYDMIRGKIATLIARERELIGRAQAVYASGGGLIHQAQHLQQRHDRAVQILNGAGALLKPLDPGGDSDSSIQAELAATRLALEVLNKASIDREGIQDAEWAVEHTAEWRAKLRKVALALAATIEALHECNDFIDAAGGGRADALPFGSIYWPLAPGIELRGLTTPADVLAAAQAEGLVKKSEIQGARNAS